MAKSTWFELMEGSVDILCRGVSGSVWGILLVTLAAWRGVLWLLLLLLVGKLLTRAKVYLGPNRVARSSVGWTAGISLRIKGISLILFGAPRGTILEIGVLVDEVIWVSICKLAGVVPDRQLVSMIVARLRMGAGVASSAHGSSVGLGSGHSCSGGDKSAWWDIDAEMESMSRTSDNNCCLTGVVLVKTSSIVDGVL